MGRRQSPSVGSWMFMVRPARATDGLIGLALFHLMPKGVLRGS
jgi:hypothetical protein